MMVNRSTMNYQSRRDPQHALRTRLRELAASRVRFGYRRLTVLPRREGWAVNTKRIYRLYTGDGLAVRAKGPKKIARLRRSVSIWQRVLSGCTASTSAVSQCCVGNLPANNFCRSWRSFHHVWWEWRLVPERIFGRARSASLDTKRG